MRAPKSSRRETTYRILKLLSDRRPHQYNEIKRKCGSGTAVARARKKLKELGFIERRAKIGRGHEYVITDFGLVMYKSKLTKIVSSPDLKASPEIRVPLSMYPRLKEDGLLSPETFATSGKIRSPLARDLLDNLLRYPDVSIWFFSDDSDLTSDDLTQIPLDDLVGWMKYSVVDYLAKKKKPALLTGFWPMDADRLPQGEDTGPWRIDEQDEFKRHLAWLKQAHDFQFHAILTYDGRSWAQTVNWDQLQKVALEKDRETKSRLDRYKTPEESRRIQQGMASIQRRLILETTLHSDEKISKFDEIIRAPFCFDKDKLYKTTWAATSQEEIDSLREEGLVEVRTALSYRLSLTTKGKAELERLKQEHKWN